jgi:hypothetical protein
VQLPTDYGMTTLGEISPELAITDRSLVFAWYDLKNKGTKVFCYDPKTLRLRWERSFQLQRDVAELFPTFSLVTDRLHLYALAMGTEGQNLFKLRLSDGEQLMVDDD